MQKGVESVSKFMMPVLIVLMVFIAVYTICTMDGAMDGVIYYLKPDFSKFSLKTVISAMGQLFYSMSLARKLEDCLDAVNEILMEKRGKKWYDD